MDTRNGIDQLHGPSRVVHRTPLGECTVDSCGATPAYRKKPAYPSVASCHFDLITPGLFHRVINNSPDCAPRYAVYAGTAGNQPARCKLGATKTGATAAPSKVETSAAHLRSMM